MPDLSESSPVGKFLSAKLPLWVSLALLLLALVALAWQQIAVQRVETRLTQERTQLQGQFETDRSALLDQARAFTQRQADTMTRRFGMAMAWAVRGELIRNNLDQVDQFFSELVKISGIEEVLLSDQAGKVLVASDKKHQGGVFAEVYPADLLQAAEIALRPHAEGGELLVIPIMGLNNRLGTLVLRQQPVLFNPQ